MADVNAGKCNYDALRSKVYVGVDVQEPSKKQCLLVYLSYRSQ